MLHRGARTKPIRVSPASVASSIARLDGAETDATSGTPASQAFCTILERGPAADHEQPIGQRQAPLEQHPPNHAVDGIVTPDVLGARHDHRRRAS